MASASATTTRGAPEKPRTEEDGDPDEAVDVPLVAAGAGATGARSLLGIPG
jgi:hypothetical protein